MTRIYHSRSPASIIGEFRKAMMNAGIMSPVELIADGKLHSFAAHDVDFDKAASYILDLHGLPVGWLRDDKAGIEQYWHLDIGRLHTVQDETEHQVQVANIRQKRDMDNMKRNAVATAKSINIWKAATPAKADHPYLVRKQIVPTDALREIPAEDAARILGYMPESEGKQLQGRLIVVRVMVGHRISTLELVDETSRKWTVVGSAEALGYLDASDAQCIEKGIC